MEENKTEFKKEWLKKRYEKRFKLCCKPCKLEKGFVSLQSNKN